MVAIVVDVWMSGCLDVVLGVVGVALHAFAVEIFVLFGHKELSAVQHSELFFGHKTVIAKTQCWRVLMYPHLSPKSP